MSNVLPLLSNAKVDTAMCSAPAMACAHQIALLSRLCGECAGLKGSIQLRGALPPEQPSRKSVFLRKPSTKGFSGATAGGLLLGTLSQTAPLAAHDSQVRAMMQQFAVVSACFV